MRARREAATLQSRDYLLCWHLVTRVGVQRAETGSAAASLEMRSLVRLSPKRVAPLLSALASLSAEPVAGQRFWTGNVAPTAERLSRIPMSSGRLATNSLPARMDLSPNFPAPGSQGSQGTCVRWAVS